MYVHGVKKEASKVFIVTQSNPLGQSVDVKSEFRYVF